VPGALSPEHCTIIDLFITEKSVQEAAAIVGILARENPMFYARKAAALLAAQQPDHGAAA
jgi:hypothetical protein